MKRQAVVRTYPIKDDDLTYFLRRGWLVVHITNTPEYIEYIVEKNETPTESKED
jgi:hypothetical protein